MLSLNNVTLTQGNFRLSADFTVPEGERVAIIGPSGGGKSTLLAAIAGFLPATAGTVAWAGQVMPDHPGDRPVSMLFQSQNLFPHLTAWQNVALGVAPNLKPSRDQKNAINKALSDVGLSDQAQHKPDQLSGGQQSRTALARVLLRHKPLILLDEPFAALGPALRDEMSELVAQIQANSGATILTVTHNLEDWKDASTMAILVADGVAAAPVATQHLLDNPPPALATYLGK